jgi:hypothetical protein
MREYCEFKLIRGKVWLLGEVDAKEGAVAIAIKENGDMPSGDEASLRQRPVVGDGG